MKQDLNQLKKDLEQASKSITLKGADDLKTSIEVIEEEAKTQEEIDKGLNKLKEEGVSIIEKYRIPREYITSVAKGFNKAFIFLGSAGIGKTFLTRQILAKQEVKFVESRGVSSPLGLYQFLYENNSEDVIIVFDDVTGLINNANAYSILLSVLWEGIANWNSTSDKLKIPKKFIFKGRIIIVTNKLEGQNSDIVKSRCLTYELKMNRDDLLDMMYEIAKRKHNKLTEKERTAIVDFIRDNVDNSIKFDLRTQQKIEQLYLYDKKNWRELAKPLLEKDEDYGFLLECLNKSKSVKEAENEFCRATNKSRRTFYNLKREITK